MDHTDLATLRQLPRHTPVIVQRGNTDLVARFRSVTELGWNESTEAHGVQVTSIETNHWGARKLTDHERGYGGYLIEKRGRAILFAGDTADTRGFARLRERAQVKLAIMPIGAYDPYIRVHASPEQAWRMADEMNAKYLLPIHHSTFKLSHEPVDEPITRLLLAAGSEHRRIAAMQIGETWEAE
jgi:L-ascorbate metabolism protein UlaG (beta-lactamase superfamily)